MKSTRYRTQYCKKKNTAPGTVLGTKPGTAQFDPASVIFKVSCTVPDTVPGTVPGTVQVTAPCTVSGTVPCIVPGTL